jgi:hypothetical protein
MTVMGAIGILAVACGGGGSKTPAGGATGAPPSATAPSAPASSATSAQAQGKLPDDPCALLTQQELTAIAANPSQGEVKSQNTPGVSEARCYWTFGDGLLSLTLSVTALRGAGTSLKPSLEAELRDAAANGHEVAGLGDYAIFTSVLPISSEVKALVKGLVLDLDVNGPNGRSLEAPVIAAAKAAAGRLP